MSLTHKLSDLSALKSFYQDVEAARDSEEKLRAMKSFHDAFTARSTAVREALSHHTEEQTKLLLTAQAEADEADQEVAALEAELAALNTGVERDATLSQVTGKAYRQFLVKRSDLVAQLKVVQDVLQGVASGNALKMQDTSDLKFAEGDSFRSKEQLLRSQVETLQADAAHLSRALVSVNDVSLTEQEEQLDEIANLALVASTSISAHRQKREATQDGIQEFEAERKRLLTWCRQQKTNLDAMTEPEHVQEFCASLLGNFPTMEENFNVLLEVAEPLLPNLDVQNGLIETNEVWFHLQVSAFERLRQVLLEIHPKSKLEDEVREFSTFSRRIRDFLIEFSNLLSAPSDAESQSLVRPVVEQCEALLLNLPAHEGLVGQLRIFAHRMEASRESYQSFRRAVLARLTFLSSSAPALTASMHRKEEYVARMKDLKKWIDVKSQGESWRDIHQRVIAIRDLIEKEQAALFAEKK
jgi:hypothetical protein